MIAYCVFNSVVIYACVIDGVLFALVAVLLVAWLLRVLYVGYNCLG